MDHLRDLCARHDLDGLRAVAGDREALNGLCHQMMRRDGDVSIEEAIEGIASTYSLTFKPMREKALREGYARGDRLVTANLQRWRRPVFDYCSPDVPLSRLMELIEGTRQWTGEDIEPWPNVDGCKGAGIVYLGLRDPFRRAAESERLYDFGQWPPGTCLEVAIVLACLAACVVYGEKV